MIAVVKACLVTGILLMWCSHTASHCEVSGRGGVKWKSPFQAQNREDANPKGVKKHKSKFVTWLTKSGCIAFEREREKCLCSSPGMIHKNYNC